MNNQLTIDHQSDEQLRNSDLNDLQLPMVEIFETIQGEGTAAGERTTFVRVYNCNLRCQWCDTKYSYAPEKPVFFASIKEICHKAASFENRWLCLTGGEPLMHGRKSIALVEALAKIPHVTDVHIETNGAIDLSPFAQLRQEIQPLGQKIRFIMDYKLPGSGEEHRMLTSNFQYLTERDEIKFVIADDRDFERAVDIVENEIGDGKVLFSPVFSSMSAKRLVEKLLKTNLKQVRVSLQLHKWIWDPDARGV